MEEVNGTFICAPEHIFGHELVTSLLKEGPSVSAEKIIKRALKICPGADEKTIRKEF